MRVGLFSSNFSPEVGGGYTFESEVFQSLVKLSTESDHTFVLFNWAKYQFQELSLEDTELASFHLSFQEHITLKLSQIARKALASSSQSWIKNYYEKFILKSILNSGVEVIWYWTPYCYPTINVPYITTVWDLQHRLQPYFPEVSIEGQWERREQSFKNKLQRASVIITGTKTGKVEIEYAYQVPKERIKILPLPTPYFTLSAQLSDDQQVLTKYHLPENYLFYPAQFWPHKNHIGLLLAVQLLRDKYNLVFPVLFVGSDKGNQEYVSSEVTKLDLSSQVHFRGFVPQQDLISLYRNAFALTFLTFFGPDNLPPLEAFALGCPVIASNVLGSEEQLGDAALLVNWRSPEQIALAIKSLHDDLGLRQLLIKRGLERASRWTGQDYVKGVFSILDELEPIRRCWSSKQPFRKV